MANKSRGAVIDFIFLRPFPGRVVPNWRDWGTTHRQKISISPNQSWGPLSHLFPTNVDFEEIVFEFQHTVSCCIILRQSNQTEMNFYIMMVEIE